MTRLRSTLNQKPEETLNRIKKLAREDGKVGKLKNVFASSRGSRRKVAAITLPGKNLNEKGE